MPLADGVSFLAASSGTGTFVFSAARTSYLTLAQAHTAGTLVDGQVVSYLAIDSVSAPTQREWGHGTYSLAGNSVARTTVLGTMNSFTPGSGSPLNFTVVPTVFLTALAEDIPPDPLFLTQGLSVAADNPTIGNNTSFRRAVDFTINYDQLNSAIGFTDQQGMSVTLNFLAGLNNYDIGASGTRAKYTPVVLGLNGIYYGAGEKFVLGSSGTFYSMGDSFLWTGFVTYAGGPIGGDEGQGITPFFAINQPKQLATGTITQVARTGYSTTVTSNITGNYIAQNIPVATTVGAVVGDWVILNQSVNSDSFTIWAMQILAINPGVSINGVCAVNLTAGMTVTPALCMVLDSQGFEFGEQRVIVNTTGASYSTGLVASVTGAAFIGSGTTWTNTMVGGNALNIGVVYLDVDTLSTAGGTGLPWAATPLKSYYQIKQVFSTTDIAIFSLSVADDLSYQGRGLPPAANMTYKILPGARIMKLNPSVNVGIVWTLVCETSTHVWNVGDVVECAICPYPDVHGFDFRFGQWNAGGARRYFLSMLNYGARTFQTGILLGDSPGSLLKLTGTDFWALGTGIQITGSQTGLVIFDDGDNTTNFAIAAISIQGGVAGHASDLGSQIVWAEWGSIGIKAANHGMDWVPTTDGVCHFRFIGSGVNIDTVQQQLVWDGYFQIAPVAGNPYLRFGGTNSAGSTNNGTMDLNYAANPSRSLQFIINQPFSSPTTVTPFVVSLNGAELGATGVATSNTTNSPSFALKLDTSTWNAGAAHTYFAKIVAVPGSGIDDAPISTQVQIWDPVHNDPNSLNLPLEVFTGGTIKFGSYNPGYTSDLRVTLDGSNLTAARTVKFMDTAGDILVAAANTTGAGSAALGANSPAVTNTAPYTWMRMISHDGSTVYVPAWK